MIGVRVAASSSASRIAATRLEAVHLRHLDVHQHQVERLLLPAARRASRPSLATVHVVAEALEEPLRDALVDLVVLGEQHPQAGARGRDRRAARRRRILVVQRAGVDAERDGEVEQAAVRPACSRPRCGRPSAPTRRFEMARPSPVPPNLRVVEPSAWMNAPKMPILLVGGDADAGVADAEAQRDAIAGRGARPSTDSRTSPCSVNLTALPSRLTSTWRSRPASPTHGRPAPAGRRRGRAQALALGGQARPRRASTRAAARSSNGDASSSSLPASIFEKSRMSLIRSSSDAALL